MVCILLPAIQLKYYLYFAVAPSNLHLTTTFFVRSFVSPRRPSWIVGWHLSGQFIESELTARGIKVRMQFLLDFSSFVLIRLQTGNAHLQQIIFQSSGVWIYFLNGKETK